MENRVRFIESHIESHIESQMVIAERLAASRKETDMLIEKLRRELSTFTIEIVDKLSDDEKHWYATTCSEYNFRCLLRDDNIDSRECAVAS